jgi:hypothetical protein
VALLLLLDDDDDDDDDTPTLSVDTGGAAAAGAGAVEFAVEEAGCREGSASGGTVTVACPSPLLTVESDVARAALKAGLSARLLVLPLCTSGPKLLSAADDADAGEGAELEPEPAVTVVADAAVTTVEEGGARNGRLTTA